MSPTSGVNHCTAEKSFFSAAAAAATVVVVVRQWGKKVKLIYFAMRKIHYHSIELHRTKKYICGMVYVI